MKAVAHAAYYAAMLGYCLCLLQLAVGHRWGRWPWLTALFAAELTKQAFLPHNARELRYWTEPLLLGLKWLASVEAFYGITDHRIPPREQQRAIGLFCSFGLVAIALTFGVYRGASLWSWYQALRQHVLTGLGIGGVVAVLYLWRFSVPFSPLAVRHGLFVAAYNVIWMAAGLSAQRGDAWWRAEVAFYVSLTLLLFGWAASLYRRDAAVKSKRRDL